MFIPPPERLIIFVKAPRAGGVKTRLAQGIGPVAATAVYRTLVATLLKNLATLSEVELRFAPDDAAVLDDLNAIAMTRSLVETQFNP